mmetsp:Transcript_281/g.744  ORF Transcript_281/g.744 Transcript_281/m.744 type:complete len:200 (+) Transcript_281:1955-2554(+)
MEGHTIDQVRRQRGPPRFVARCGRWSPGGCRGSFIFTFSCSVTLWDCLPHRISHIRRRSHRRADKVCRRGLLLRFRALEVVGRDLLDACGDPELGRFVVVIATVGSRLSERLRLGGFRRQHWQGDKKGALALVKLGRPVVGIHGVWQREFKVVRSGLAAVKGKAVLCYVQIHSPRRGAFGEVHRNHKLRGSTGARCRVP